MPVMPCQPAGNVLAIFEELPTKDQDRTTYMGTAIEVTPVMIQQCCTVWSALQTY